MALSTMPKNLVFPVAGHFLLIPYGANGLPDMTRAYSSKRGIVVSISRDTTLNTSDLPDGNSPYPAATYVTTQEGTLTYVLSTYDPELEALVAGADYEDGNATDKEMWTISTLVVPARAPFTYTFDTAKPRSIDELVIEDGFGNRFTVAETADSVAEGTFSYDSETGVITFAEADRDKSLSAIFSYDGTAITAISYKENPKLTAFMAIVVGETKDMNETISQKTNIIVDRCSVSGTITPPQQTNDPTQGWTLTTNILKPREGRSPVKVKFENIVE